MHLGGFRAVCAQAKASETFYSLSVIQIIEGTKSFYGAWKLGTQIVILKKYFNRWKGENRIALTPEGVGKLKKMKFNIEIEKGAGVNASFSDSEYIQAGATIAEDVWNNDMILKGTQVTHNKRKLFRNTWFHTTLNIYWQRETEVSFRYSV